MSAPNYCRFSTCRRQSFRRMLWKSAGDCMRNANKSPKICYSVMARKVEKWSVIRIQDRITTKSKPILPIGRPNYNTEFSWNQLTTFAVIIHTNTQTDRQTDRLNNWQTNRTDHITSTLAEVTNSYNVINEGESGWEQAARYSGWRELHVGRQPSQQADDGLEMHRDWSAQARHHVVL